MAKRRTNGRKRRKVANFNQSMQRKRSEKQPHRPSKVAYSQAALEPSSSTISPGASESAGNRNDLSGLANEFGRTLEKFSRALNDLSPASGRQQAGEPPRIWPMEQSPSATHGLLVINRELLNHLIEQGQLLFQAMIALARSRSPQDVFRVHIDLVKANLDRVLEAASRILAVVMQMTTQAIRFGQLGRSRA